MSKFYNIQGGMQGNAPSGVHKRLTAQPTQAVHLSPAQRGLLKQLEASGMGPVELKTLERAWLRQWSIWERSR